MALLTYFLRRPWLLALLVFAAAAVPVAWFHHEWMKDARQRDQDRLAACAAAIREALLAESIRHQHMLQSWRERAESAADYAAWQREVSGDSALKDCRFRAVGIAVWAGAELKVRLVIPLSDAAPFADDTDLAAIPQVGAALAAEGKKRKGIVSASEPFAIPQLGERVVTLTGWQRGGDERGVIFAVLSPPDFLAPAETTMHRMKPRRLARGEDGGEKIPAACRRGNGDGERGFRRDLRAGPARRRSGCHAEFQRPTALENERELVRLKSQFVNTVSHEFRTPLGVILSSADILAHYFDRLPGEQRAQHLRDIHDSSVQMSRMLEQVLDLGRMEAGRLAFQPRPLDLPPVLGRIADESRSANGGEVRFSAEGDLSGASADESLLRHIFINLLSNACKYSAAGAITDFTVCRDGDSAALTVRDRGIGIPARDLPHVFEAFARGGNVAAAHGTGLGLAIVQRCVPLHGGTIHLASTEGAGTTVTVRLPLFAGTFVQAATGNPP